MKRRNMWQRVYGEKAKWKIENGELPSTLRNSLLVLSIFPDQFCSLSKHFLLKIDALEGAGIITDAIAQITIFDGAAVKENNVF